MSQGTPDNLQHELWLACVERLAQDMPEQQFNTWIRPLTARVADDLTRVTVLVGNRFKMDWVRTQYAARITAMSIFFIFIIASVARCALARSGSFISSRRRFGTTCQDNPNLSLAHPHGPSSPPSVSLDQ